MSLPAGPSARFWALPSVAVAILACGCVSHTVRLEPVRASFQSGDLVGADRLLAAEAGRPGADEHLLLLDRGMVALVDGRPAEAERLLRLGRDGLDRCAAENAAETAGSLLADDAVRGYAGEDHERVMVRAMLAIANLLQDGDDAEAYGLQVACEQRRIMEAAAEPDGTNPKAAYREVAFAPYLRGVLREATHRHYDDAARGFRQVVEWQPDFRPGQEHLERATGGIHSRPGNGVVHVVALVGHGPFKVEAEEVPTSTTLLMADRMLGVGLGRSLPPSVAPIRLPRVVAAPGAAATVGVAVGDQLACQTETITNISQMALGQEEATRSTRLARAVARRAVKKTAVTGIKQGLGVGDSLPGLVFDVAGVVWEASERADTRCWTLLPHQIQVLRLELPAGRHALVLRPLDGHGNELGEAVPAAVDVLDGRDTYVLVRAADRGVIGRPQVSGR